jgi:hypothetical protein
MAEHLWLAWHGDYPPSYTLASLCPERIDDWNRVADAARAFVLHSPALSNADGPSADVSAKGSADE